MCGGRRSCPVEAGGYPAPKTTATTISAVTAAPVAVSQYRFPGRPRSQRPAATGTRTDVARPNGQTNGSHVWTCEPIHPMNNQPATHRSVAYDPTRAMTMISGTRHHMPVRWGAGEVVVFTRRPYTARAW